MITAQRLQLQAVANEVLHAFDLAQTAVLLIKGEATARAFYEPTEVRLTRDVDVLVRDPAAAAVVLRRLGLSMRLRESSHEAAPHSTTWSRGEDWPGLTSYLHTTFHGVGVPDEELWEAWWSAADVVDLFGRPTRVPGWVDTLFLTAVHDGRSTGGAVAEDLTRALVQGTSADWRAAHARAVELNAVELFHTGLVVAGADDLLTDLGLSHEFSAREALQRRHGGPSSRSRTLPRRHRGDG